MASIGAATSAKQRRPNHTQSTSPIPTTSSFEFNQASNSSCSGSGSNSIKTGVIKLPPFTPSYVDIVTQLGGADPPVLPAPRPPPTAIYPTVLASDLKKVNTLPPLHFSRKI
jgi:hypothetical protein